MNLISRVAACLALLFLVACSSESATPAAFDEFRFSAPCSELREFFSTRGIQTRGDPLRANQQMTIFFDHPMFRVVEIRCARLQNANGETEPMPAEINFFSAGKDENGRLTQGSLALQEKLAVPLGAPWKKLQTGRWDAAEWTGGPSVVRQFKNGPQDTEWVRVIFSRYPANSPEDLDKSLGQFLSILKAEPLAPAAEK
jgi:hypothetical protein